MKLIKDGIASNPGWTFNTKIDQLSQHARVILPFKAYLENHKQLRDSKTQVGIRIDINTNLDDISPFFTQLGVIVIEFSSFTDGRGFSTANRLRYPLGYEGNIWASGNLIPDQYAFAMHCNFDAILVDDELLIRQPIKHWQQALVESPTPYRYQDDMLQNSAMPNYALGCVADDKIILELNAKFNERPTEELLQFALDHHHMGRSVLVSSFGTESVVLLHLMAKLSPKTPVLFIDTGKLFAETLAYQVELAEKLQLSNIKILKPDKADINHLDPKGRLWQSDNSTCCKLRKQKPLQKALVEYDTWISGRKSFQSEQRAPLQLFERSGHHIKVNPLAKWHHYDIKDYMRRHDLPAHPLIEHGYTSVGCSPCTTPVCSGEHDRAGRWRDSPKNECGIHFVEAHY